MLIFKQKLQKNYLWLKLAPFVTIIVALQSLNGATTTLLIAFMTLA